MMESGDENYQELVEINQSIAELRDYVLDMFSMCPPIVCDWYLMSEERQELALDAVDSVLNIAETDGILHYPCLRDWNNARYIPGYGLLPVPEPRKSSVTGDSLRKMINILELIRDLIINDQRTTKRDIYYQMFVNFSSQIEVDRLVAISVALLQVPRLFLGVMATSKGLVVGDLKYTNVEGVTVDCNLAVGGDTIPQDVSSIHVTCSDARFILVVEKDAVFQRLLEEGILTSVLAPLIMITGKGVPDLATRQLLYHLSSYLRIPVIILTDCDPYGMDIFLMYKYGSLAMTWANEPLAVPSSVWLGLLPTDLDEFNISSDCMKPHSDQDHKKMLELNKRAYLDPDQFDDCEELKIQLETMWKVGRKAEIQQLVDIADPGFLTHQFLPRKIARCSWV